MNKAERKKEIIGRFELAGYCQIIPTVLLEINDQHSDLTS